MSSEPVIITLGCRLNAAESDAIGRMATEASLSGSVIVNSCAVTGRSVRTTRHRIRRARRQRPDARIIVTGCAAQIDPESFSSMPEVDAVIGNSEKLKPEVWKSLAASPSSPVMVNDIMSVRETALHMMSAYGDRARAYLQIQNGCSHRCTFCIIPYGRGNSRSVPVGTVLDNARRLVDAGHRELVLTGVDIVSYGRDLDPPSGLGRLVGTILDAVPGLYRLRLSSVDCSYIDTELYERLSYDTRVAPHLHLSLQSGDNLVLKRMKRRHCREQAVDLCRDLRSRRSGMAFGADIIVGFPTETEEMFRRSIDIIDEAGLNFLHVFPFSPRHGTPAARMPQTDRRIVAERAARLRAAGTRARHLFLDSLTGRQHDDAVQESGGQVRLGNFACVQLDDDSGKPGDIRQIRILSRDGDSLAGRATDRSVSG